MKYALKADFDNNSTKYELVLRDGSEPKDEAEAIVALVEHILYQMDQNGSFNKKGESFTINIDGTVHVYNARKIFDNVLKQLDHKPNVFGISYTFGPHKFTIVDIDCDNKASTFVKRHPYLFSNENTKIYDIDAFIDVIDDYMRDKKILIKDVPPTVNRTVNMIFHYSFNDGSSIIRHDENIVIMGVNEIDKVEKFMYDSTTDTIEVILQDERTT